MRQHPPATGSTQPEKDYRLFVVDKISKMFNEYLVKELFPRYKTCKPLEACPRKTYSSVASLRMVLHIVFNFF